MEPTALFLAVLGAGLAGALGYIGRGYLRAGAAQQRFEAAAAEAEQIAERTRKEAEDFLHEHVETARADLRKDRDEFRRRVQRLDLKAAALKERQEKTRAKMDAARERLDARAAQLAQRETIVEQALDTVDALTAEAARRGQETEALQEQIQSLAKTVGRRQQELAARELEVDAMHARLQTETERLDDLVARHLAKLEQAANLSRDEARQQLVDELTREAKLEASGLVKDARDEARRTAQREAQKVILKAMQRLAASTTIEHTISTVEITSEDMKGRVIGREGRNIRAFEAATGVEVIVDDTPDAVLVSGFDPVRREVARLSLIRLLADGRIQPARIEEIVELTRKEIEEEIVLAGEQAALELQIHGLHPELIKLVGRMKYRSSFGQNLLSHSVEVAKLASMMAAELGIDTRKAKRAGLLHDIGKVVEEEIEQPHAIVGMELCRRYKEHPDVCNAVGAHHDEVPMATLVAPLVQTADAASGARPGARREALDRYVQRLKDLEAIAMGIEGVVQAYAIQAGREVRVVVDAEQVSDAVAEMISVDICRRIEREMEYPGQIRVTVIREVRAVSIAR
jgi:ribonuclease Y